MVIKKYLVTNMNEAMTRIRLELGSDAVIISQRNVKQGGFLGLFAKKFIEVTAAKDNSNVKEKKVEVDNTDALEAIRVAMSKNIFNDNKNTEKISEVKENKVITENKDSANSELSNDVREMKKILSKLVTENEDSDIIKKLKSEDILDEIINDVENLSIKDINNKFLNILKIDDKDLMGNVVLVGPTGVGKTTTIAKLAGKLSLLENKKVGLITIDTYRIGAVEQLKTYAEIMNIKFEVVLSLGEMDAAIKNMDDCDVVLIDTTGRSSNNKMQILELRAFVEKTKPSNISLVVCATTKNKDIKLILNAYKPLGFENVIITKLDETSVKGAPLNIAVMSGKPIKFITTGQNVPNDIATPVKENIILDILGEKVLC